MAQERAMGSRSPEEGSIVKMDTWYWQGEVGMPVWNWHHAYLWKCENLITGEYSDQTIYLRTASLVPSQPH
jgi:hypothetical protein